MEESYSTDQNYTNPMVSKPETEEQIRFSKFSPLRTLIQLSIGPLVFQLGIAIHDALDLYMISKAFKGDSIQIVGFASLVRYLSMSFSIFFSQACVARISTLIGEGNFGQASQVVADLYCISFISMIFVSIVFYFLTPFIMIFMGCTNEMSYQAREYLLPILVSIPVISLFQLSCGVLLAVGRSFLSGIVQFAAFTLNIGIFAPILFFYFKIPFKYCGIAFALSQAIPGIIMTAIVFSNGFNIEIRFSQLFCKPSTDTIMGMKQAAPYILSVFSGAIPPMVLINFIMRSAASQGIIDSVAKILSVLFKLQAIVNSFSIGIGQGFLSSGNFASGSKNNNRLLSLFTDAIIITFLLQMVFLPFFLLESSLITGIWLRKEYLQISAKYLKIPFFTNWLTSINEITTNFLLTQTLNKKAIIPSVSRSILFLAGSFTLYYTNKNDSKRMMYEYCINDIGVLLVDIILIISPLSSVVSNKCK